MTGHVWCSSDLLAATRGKQRSICGTALAPDAEAYPRYRQGLRMVLGEVTCCRCLSTVGQWARKRAGEYVRLAGTAEANLAAQQRLRQEDQ